MKWHSACSPMSAPGAPTPSVAQPGPSLQRPGQAVEPSGVRGVGEAGSNAPTSAQSPSVLGQSPPTGCARETDPSAPPAHWKRYQRPTITLSKGHCGCDGHCKQKSHRISRECKSKALVVGGRGCPDCTCELPSCHRMAYQSRWCKRHRRQIDLLPESMKLAVFASRYAPYLLPSDISVEFLKGGPAILATTEDEAPPDYVKLILLSMVTQGYSRCVPARRASPTTYKSRAICLTFRCALEC